MQTKQIAHRALPLIPVLLMGAGLNQTPAHLEPAFWKGQIPDALVTADGRRIENSEDWMRLRRPELLQLFSTVVYGKPIPAPAGIEFKLLERNDNALNGKAIRIQGDIVCKGVDQPNPFRMLVYLPKQAKGPVPVFLGLNFLGDRKSVV